MMAALLQNLALLFAFWLPRVHPTPCGLTVHPVDPVVPFGGSVTLNCTSSCVNDTTLKWESSSEGDVQKGDWWTTVSFDNITNWNLQPVCFQEPRSNLVKMPIYVYQFSPPEIYLASDIVVDRQHTILCNISSVVVRGQAPRNINVSLSSGGHMLNNSQGRSSVAYSSVAQLSQDGMEVLCMAHVVVGKEVLEKTANSTLKVSASPYNVSVTSSTTTYKAGSNIIVTCHADGKPFPEIVWQLPSTDQAEFSDGNRTVTIWSAQSSHNGTYRCHAQNAYGSYSADVDILYEGTSRNWVTTVVVVMLVLPVLVTAAFICYKCRK